MEATCFGFEEDEGAAPNDKSPSKFVNVKPTFRFNVPSKPRVARTVLKKVHSEETELTSNLSPISITQVQELLCEDLSPTNESSFYEELNEETQNSELETSTRVEPVGPEDVEETPVRKVRKKKKPLLDIENDMENAKNLKKTPVRVFGKTVRNKKRPLEEIQNFDGSTETILQDSIAKPVMRKKGKKDIENAKNEVLLNELAERMNSKFKEVEEYQLVVE